MNAEAEGRLAAERFRREHGLGTQPLGDLVAIIEQATRIDVAVLNVGPDEHGLTMRDPLRGTVFVGVARTRNPMRQRSTLAHELGHVLFEDWTPNNDSHWSERKPTEIRADAFARHLLVPLGGLRELLQSREPREPREPRTTLTQADLSSVVQRFLVSPAIAAIALSQAKYLDDATKSEWMSVSASQLAGRFGWSDQYHALQADSDRQRAPQRLLARAISGYAEGVLSAQTIATLRGIPLAIAEAELREAGVEPSAHPIAWTDSTDLPDARVDLEELDNDLNLPGNDRCTLTERDAQ